MGWGTESPEDCWFQRHCLQGPAPPPAPLPSSAAAPAQGIADASQEHSCQDRSMPLGCTGGRCLVRGPRCLVPSAALHRAKSGVEAGRG